MSNNINRMPMPIPYLPCKRNILKPPLDRPNFTIAQTHWQMLRYGTKPLERSNFTYSPNI